MSLTIDWGALALLMPALIVIYLLKNYFFSSTSLATLAFSQLENLETSSSLRERFHFLPKRLYWTSLCFFLLAFLDPHLMSRSSEKNSDELNNVKVIPTEGIAIYLLLDQSGSMAQTVLVSEEGSRKQIPKIDLLKQVTKGFIDARANDLIGLIYFARIPHVVAPLTLDHALLLKDLTQLRVIDNQQNDGTSLGYAIFKAANLIGATRHYAEELNRADPSQYQIKNAIIIAVTDGMQDPNYRDKGNRLRTMELEESAEFTKSQNIKLYIINIDSAFATEKYAPHRRQMQKITQLTGGEFYLASDGKDLKEIYAQIDALEKSPIPQVMAQDSPESRRFSFYPYLIIVGMICFFLACLLESFYFKSIP